MLVVSGGSEITSLRVRLPTQSWLGWQESQVVVLCPDFLRIGLLWDLKKDWCNMDGDASFMMNWAEDLIAGGRGRVKIVSETVENRWKNKLRMLFPKKRTKSGCTHLFLKSSTPSFETLGVYSTECIKEGTKDHFLELILTYSISSQPLEDDPPPVLGPEF
jgi:hypothetical protein